jgi:hypothetical protein
MYFKFSVTPSHHPSTKLNHRWLLQRNSAGTGNVDNVQAQLFLKVSLLSLDKYALVIVNVKSNLIKFTDAMITGRWNKLNLGLTNRYVFYESWTLLLFSTIEAKIPPRLISVDGESNSAT